MTERNQTALLSPRAFAWLVAAAVAAYIVLYPLSLGRRPLFIPDESRYAEIPRGMVTDGDWAHLRHAGIAYYEKPPLGYWLTAASLRLFGFHASAVRLPSALAAGLSALALCLLLLRAGRSRDAALAAAIVFLSCMGVFGVGTYAVLDSMFTLFTTLSMAAYYCAGAHSGRRRGLWLLLSGAACGAAFLTKGFTAMVIPALTLAAWLPWERRWRELLRVWTLPLLAAAAVVLPFALIIHAANPEFWSYFIWVEHVQRFLNPGHGQHGQPIWFYLPVLAAATLPWVFFLPATVPETARRAAADPLARFCLCWFLMPALFLSVCGGKLPTYILPCLAPFAVLTADAFTTMRESALPRHCALAGAALLPAVLLGFSAWLRLGGDPELRDAIFMDANWKYLAAAAVAAALLLAAASRLFGGGRSRLPAIALTALSFCVVYWGSIFFLPAESEDRKSPSRLLEAAVPQTPPGALLIADVQTFSSVSWHYGRADAVLAGGSGEFAYGIDRADVKDRHIQRFDRAAETAKRRLKAGTPVAVVLRRPHFDMFASGMAGIEPDGMLERSVFVWALYVPAGRDGEP